MVFGLVTKRIQIISTTFWRSFTGMWASFHPLITLGEIRGSCAWYSWGCTLTDNVMLLGAFAKLRKATICFAMTVCPSVRPHASIRFPLKIFSWHLIFDYLFETLSRKFKFHSSLKRLMCTLHENLCTFMRVCRWILLIMRNGPDKVVAQFQTNVMFIIVIPNIVLLNR